MRVVVIGGGQAGLAAGFYLQTGRTRPARRLRDSRPSSEPGGAWPHMWDSLRLFSPARYSSLPGRPMPPWSDGYPPADHVRAYLADYEMRYDLPVFRPARARTVTPDQTDPKGRLLVHTDDTVFPAQFVVSATGTWQRPFWPAYPGIRLFGGRSTGASKHSSPTSSRLRRSDRSARSRA